jgi:hypothetical protein
LSLTVIFYSYHTINPFTHSNIPINTDAQQFIALYGKTLVKTSPYGEKNIVALTFIVGDTSGDAITTKIYSEFEVFILASFSLIYNQNRRYSY